MMENLNRKYDVLAFDIGKKTAVTGLQNSLNFRNLQLYQIELIQRKIILQNTDNRNKYTASFSD